MSFPDPYKALAITPDATPEQIRTAYRLLARRYHPDTAGNQGRAAVDGMFQQVTEAYKLLSDPDQRRRYDAIRALLEQASAPKSEPDDPWINTFAGSAHHFYSHLSQMMGGSAMVYPPPSRRPPAPQPSVFGPSRVSVVSAPGRPARARYSLVFTQNYLRQAAGNPLDRYTPGKMFFENGKPMGMIVSSRVDFDQQTDLLTLELEIDLVSPAPFRNVPLRYDVP